MITDSMYYFLKTMDAGPMMEAELTETQRDLREAALTWKYIRMETDGHDRLCYFLTNAGRMALLSFEDKADNAAQEKEEKAADKRKEHLFQTFLALLSFVLGMITENWTGFIQLIVDAIHSVTP